MALAGTRYAAVRLRYNQKVECATACAAKNRGRGRVGLAPAAAAVSDLDRRLFVASRNVQRLHRFSVIHIISQLHDFRRALVVEYRR